MEKKRVTLEKVITVIDKELVEGKDWYVVKGNDGVKYCIKATVGELSISQQAAIQYYSSDFKGKTWIWITGFTVIPNGLSGPAKNILKSLPPLPEPGTVKPSFVITPGDATILATAERVMAACINHKLLEVPVDYDDYLLMITGIFKDLKEVAAR